ncbi:MAG: phosphoglycerate kinase [Thermoproteus sp. AZ2]|uniref:Phosphoglycerate kinase n=1 Tax=Thermoproteus sp. AZ2 TaxID=1609232 RepID=A0ACC6UZX4_9CREN
MLEHVLSTIPTLDKCSIRGKIVLIRIDINSPIYNGKILDDYRIRAHVRTLRELADSGARVVVLAHQGRPGQDDFTSLSIHRDLLEKYSSRAVDFIEDVIGPAAVEKIKGLGEGEILLLENVRLLAEELIEAPPERHAQSWLVAKLSPLANYYVFDGFAVAHRSQPSVVGFPMRLPSCIGRVMESELRALAEIWRNRERALLIVGGAKVPESIRAMAEALERGAVSRVLVGGLVGLVFAASKYGGGPAVRSFLEKNGLVAEVERARRLLEIYGDSIVLPLDFRNSRGEVFKAAELADLPVDIGDGTVELYKNTIKDYDMVVVTGPMGKIEDQETARGTIEILKAASERRAVIGGGHTILAAERAGLIERLFHVSTGGRAFLMAFSEDLPALKALLKSVERFWR